MTPERILIIGAGTMGAGIAQWFCQQGAHVTLRDVDTDFAEKARQRIFSSLDSLVTKGKLEAGPVATMKTKLEVAKDNSALATIDLAIEVIVEKLEIKNELLRELDRELPASAVIASNTSSIPISTLAKALSPERQKRFLGLHFFNPATIMKLVEIIRGEKTDPELCLSFKRYFENQGKQPALCSDGPGFIVNRVARGFYGEALRMVGDDATEERLREIDNAMKEAGGFAMGPFELMDLIGVDVNLDVTKSVWKAFGENPRFAPHSLQERMVEQKRFGKKSKQGFYRYE
jgi:3-hydroxybutyryl-CoA dehydrogenase